jgi:hypothetical protein
VVVECRCSSDEEWRRRIEQRALLRLPAHHITSWEHLEAHLKRRAHTSNYPIQEPHLVVDTLAPLDQVLETIIAWLETERQHQPVVPSGDLAGRVDSA